MGMQYSRGLVAGYPFENTAADIMGVNNGTVYGATYVDGQCGRALSFDGVDDFVTLPNFVFLPTSDNSSFSVSCRVKIPNTINGFGTLCVLNGWQLFVMGDTNYGVGFRNLNTGASGISTNMPSRNIYHHIVYVNNNGIKSIYINTLIPNTFSSPGYNVLVPNNIGLYNINYSSTLFKGIIDNLQIFNRALTVNEIKRLYLNLGI
jgi:hypothetical protein